MAHELSFLARSTISGHMHFPDLHETSPQNPVTVKGRIRVEMENRLHAASFKGASTLIVRAGDFFGTQSR